MNVGFKSVLQPATSWMARGSIPDREKGFFSSRKPARPTVAVSTPTPLLYIPYQVSYPAIKQPLRGADRSPPPNAEVKHEWSYTSTFLHAFMELKGTTLLLPLPHSKCSA